MDKEKTNESPATEKEHPSEDASESVTGNAMSIPASLREQVTAFHKRFGHPVGTVPHVPSDEIMRFRMALIYEEFRELFSAVFERAVLDSDLEEAFGTIQDRINSQYPYARAPVKVDLPELADALADLDYVIEGTRVTMGIDGGPIADLVHQANMAKDPIYVTSKDQHHRTPNPAAKPQKPKGWLPPDVEGELKRQGAIDRGSCVVEDRDTTWARAWLHERGYAFDDLPSLSQLLAFMRTAGREDASDGAVVEAKATHVEHFDAACRRERAKEPPHDMSREMTVGELLRKLDGYGSETVVMIQGPNDQTWPMAAWVGTDDDEERVFLPAKREPSDSSRKGQP